MTYDLIFRPLGNIQEPVLLEVHPDNFNEVARGLKEAAIRNSPEWPLIHLQKNPYVPKGVIIWLKQNLMTSIEPLPSSSQTPNSSVNINTSSD